MSARVIPRILIAAPASASGKTTVTCALLRLLANAAAVKCGPDFIDPLFHRQVSGRPAGNIDLFFTPPALARALFARQVQGADVAVCEGAMGFYDGVAETESASAYDVARALSCPVILVVDANGKSLSLCAEINGFAAFRERDGDRSGIRGVILNRCSPAQYERLAPAIARECGVRAVGFLPQDDAFSVASRHLGLVTPDAVPDLRQKLDALADSAKQTLDVAAIMRIAQSAAPLEYDAAVVPEVAGARVRIALAQDEAFCFYYRENLELLAAFGAELVPFSPLRDQTVPDGCHAIYLGGGYPELFPSQLAANTAMLQSVRAFCRSGAPVLAECGGFLYLKLAGMLAGTFGNAGHLVRFGYVTLTANEDTFLCRKGDQIRAHEFHYFDTTHNGSAFTAQKSDGTAWQCIESAAPVADMPPSCSISRAANIVAGFPHLSFASNPAFARNFVHAAREFSARGRTGCAGCGGCPAGHSCGGCGQ